MSPSQIDREYRDLMERQDWKALSKRARAWAARFLSVVGHDQVRLSTTSKDLANEAIMRIVSGKARWDPNRGAKLDTYLHTVLSNLVKDHIDYQVKREHVSINPAEGETVESAIDRAWDRDRDPFGRDDLRSRHAWAEAVVTEVIAKVEGVPVLDPMVDYMFETGDHKRSRIAEHVGVSPDDITNASKRLRRVTKEVVERHQAEEGAQQLPSSRRERGA